MKQDKQILAEATYFRMVLQDGWEYIEPKKFSGVVMIIPITDDGKLVLIEQHRIPVNASCIEIPAGLVGDQEHLAGETLETAARRELIEETGYDAQTLTHLLDGAPSAGSNTVLLSFFLAEGLTKVGPGGGDHTEDIRIHEVPMAEVDDFLDDQRAQGKVIDLKTYVALHLATRHRASDK
jgi:ADP-ribose pyrophosphatase